MQSTRVTCYKESLADETKSPLFVISEQDLKLWSESGDYSYDYSLQHAFKCAYKWKALLFIDEADNFVIRNDNSYFMGKFATNLPLDKQEANLSSISPAGRVLPRDSVSGHE
jgi:hypothetical protein